MDFTISCSQGHIAEHHDKRDYYPDNADQSLQDNNRTVITTTDYDNAFREYFQDSVDEYNATQKRADRRKNDYLDEIANGDGKEHPYYEYVIQIGNHDTNGTLDTSPDAMKAREALDATADKLQEKYPSFKFWFIGSHGDEPNGTYHYHVCFTPVGTGYKNGMKTRCSLNKALENMGFKSKGKPYPIDLWKQDVEATVEEEMKQRGLGRAYKNEHRKRLDVKDYQREQMVKDAGDLLEQAQTKNTEAQNEWNMAIKFHKTVKQREQAVTDKEQELEKQDDDMTSAFKGAVEEITGYEYDDDITVEELISEVNEYKDDLLQRETALNDRERALDEKDKDLYLREQKLENRAKNVDKIQGELQRMLDTEKDTVNKQTYYLKKLQAYDADRQAKQDIKQQELIRKQKFIDDLVAKGEEYNRQIGYQSDGEDYLP